METTAIDLAKSRCKPCEGGVDPLRPEETQHLAKQIAGWQVGERSIARSYTFTNHYQAVSFVNAIAWISHREDHHPDIELGYNAVKVSYTTHAIGGLSVNDFICAAKVDALFEL